MSGNNQTTLDELERAIGFMISKAMILTSLFHWCLFGILSVQLFLYHNAFPRDRVAIRVISWLIYSVEVIQGALMARRVYVYLGIDFGNVNTLLFSPFDAGDMVFIVNTGLIGLICQCFSAWRIWVLSRSKIMVASVVILSLQSTVSTFVGGTRMVRTGGNGGVSTFIWATSTALCEVIIAVFMGLILNRSKAIVQKSTKVRITRLLWLVVTTGTFNALMAVIALILLAVSPNTVLYTPIVYLMGKVETNSYFAVLNSRMRLMTGSTQDDADAPCYSDHEVVSGGFEMAPRFPATESTLSWRPVVQVQVQQQVEFVSAAHNTSFHVDEVGNALVKDDIDEKDSLVLKNWPKS